jgi:hypothetical protein
VNRTCLRTRVLAYMFLTGCSGGLDPSVSAPDAGVTDGPFSPPAPAPQADAHSTLLQPARVALQRNPLALIRIAKRISFRIKEARAAFLKYGEHVRRRAQPKDRARRINACGFRCSTQWRCTPRARRCGGRGSLHSAGRGDPRFPRTFRGNGRGRRLLRHRALRRRGGSGPRNQRAGRASVAACTARARRGRCPPRNAHLRGT